CHASVDEPLAAVIDRLRYAVAGEDHQKHGSAAYQCTSGDDVAGEANRGIAQLGFNRVCTRRQRYVDEARDAVTTIGDGMTVNRDLPGREVELVDLNKCSSVGVCVESDPV